MRQPVRPEYAVDPVGEFPLPPDRYLFYLLFQAQRQRDLFFDRTAGSTGLTLQRWRTLAVIRRIENCSMKDLALYTAVDRTTLTRTIDQLVAQGLVERWSPPGDRRRVNVTLTAEGEARCEEAAGRMAEGNRILLAGVDEASARTAARVLQHLIRKAVGDPLTAERLLAYGGPVRTAKSPHAT
jgi:DNA-binding MarR family transcriptional regulator